MRISMHVFITGGTGHAGSYVIPELIAAGHEVTALARSEESAAAVSALGAKVRRGSLDDLEGLKAAASESDGVIHLAYRADLLASGGLKALCDSELSIVLAFGEAMAGSGKPPVVAGSIGAPTNAGREKQASLGRPATEQDPALSAGPAHAGTLRARNVVEMAVVGLADPGVRASVVRIPPIAHSQTDRAGFLQQLIGLGKQKGFVGYPGNGANLWSAVHIRDLAPLFRLALEQGASGKTWHAIDDEGVPLREIATAIATRLGLPAVSIPADELMVPGYFGFLAALVTLDLSASSAITRQTLGWAPAQPGLLDDLDNGHYFPTVE